MAEATARRAPAKKTTAARKAPQDRLPKQQQSNISGSLTSDGRFQFTAAGATFVSESTVEDQLTFGFLRKYGDNDVLMMVRLIEALFVDQDDAMVVLDGMRQVDMNRLVESLNRQMVEATGGTGMGES